MDIRGRKYIQRMDGCKIDGDVMRKSGAWKILKYETQRQMNQRVQDGQKECCRDFSFWIDFSP